METHSTNLVQKYLCFAESTKVKPHWGHLRMTMEKLAMGEQENKLAYTRPNEQYFGVKISNKCIHR